MLFNIFVYKNIKYLFSVISIVGFILNDFLVRCFNELYVLPGLKKQKKPRKGLLIIKEDGC